MNICFSAQQQSLDNQNYAATNEIGGLDALQQNEFVNDKILAGETIIKGGISEERIKQTEMICMTGSSFDDLAAEYLAAEVFPRAPMLRVVDLSATRFSSSGIVLLLRALRQGPSDVLGELSLCDIHLHDEECTAIQRLMVKHRSCLKRLQLRRCHIDDVAAQAVAEGVAQAESLSYLGIADNDVVPAFALPIAAADVLFFPASLKVIDISGNHIDPAHNHGLSFALRRCAATLEELYMARCCVTQATLESLLRVGFHASKSLRVLNVSSGRLLSSAGRTLCSFITECPNLERLYVQNNLIEADGAEVMAIGLQCAKKLTVLGMGNCHLGGAGARVIAEALQYCPALRELDLSSNSICDEDVEFICLRRDNAGLRLNFLDLSCNPLTKKSCSSLQALIERQREATCVVLIRGTGIGDDLTYMSRNE